MEYPHMDVISIPTWSCSRFADLYDLLICLDKIMPNQTSRELYENFRQWALCGHYNSMTVYSTYIPGYVMLSLILINRWTYKLNCTFPFSI